MTELYVMLGYCSGLFLLQWFVLVQSHSGAAHQAGLIVIIIIHEVHGDTSLKQNVRAAVNVTY